jgi:AcrR family transcriptional regulator
VTDADGTSARDATRERIVEATLRCVGRWGLAKTTVEDVAAAAGLSRATVYRAFPGGRDEVISETVVHEVRLFLARIEGAIVDDRGIATKLEHALLVGHRAIDDHHLLQQLLSTERDTMLVELADAGPLMVDVIKSELAIALQAEQLRPGVEPAVAAEYLARLYLSYLGSPGRIDLTDADAVRRLVATQFVAGVLAPTSVPTAPGSTDERVGS